MRTFPWADPAAFLAAYVQNHAGANAGSLHMRPPADVCALIDANWEPRAFNPLYTTCIRALDADILVGGECDESTHPDATWTWYPRAGGPARHHTAWLHLTGDAQLAAA
eukprot:gene2053-3235_t